VVGDRLVDEHPTGVGQRDDAVPGVVRVRAAGDQPAVLEALQPVGRRGR
jgi:hypothetical protein